MEISEKLQSFEEEVGIFSRQLNTYSRAQEILASAEQVWEYRGFRAICTVIHVEECLVILKWKSVGKPLVEVLCVCGIDLCEAVGSWVADAPGSRCVCEGGSLTGLVPRIAVSSCLAISCSRCGDILPKVLLDKVLFTNEGFILVAPC